MYLVKLRKLKICCASKNMHNSLIIGIGINSIEKLMARAALWI